MRVKFLLKETTGAFDGARSRVRRATHGAMPPLCQFKYKGEISVLK